MKKQRTVLIVGGLVPVGAASLLIYLRRQRKDPSACPYGLRFSLDLPHPFVTRPRLREMLSPEPGQRVLEVGPGTGYYALEVARWLEPGCALDILDIQQEMLDYTMRRAHALGISNIIPTRGDAQALPYPDDHFDSHTWSPHLVRSPTKGGRCAIYAGCSSVVVGEVLLDPHKVTFEELRRLTDAGGLDHERTFKGTLGYLAAFRAT